MEHVNFESLNCEVTENKILNQSVINIHPNKQSDCIKSTDLVLPVRESRKATVEISGFILTEFSHWISVYSNSINLAIYVSVTFTKKVYVVHGINRILISLGLNLMQ